jgi:large subunit ribosomal protein L10
MKPKAHVSNDKKKIVEEFKALIKEYPVVGAVDVEKLPAKQLMIMRRKLQGSAHIQMSKRRLLAIALEESGIEGLPELKNHLKGMPALLFSKDNPFKLFKILKKNKSPAPLKSGETAPKDVVVPAGPTGFAPGPIIGELGSIGLKAGIEGGKVAIKEEKIVLKEGEKVNAKLAALLQRLEIFPGEIGLNLTAVFENGDVLTKSVLDIDEDAFLAQITGAANDAFRLTIGISLPVKENITHLISLAQTDAVKLSDGADILTNDNVDSVLAKAEARASALKSKLN